MKISCKTKNPTNNHNKINNFRLKRKLKKHTYSNCDVYITN